MKHTQEEYLARIDEWTSDILALIELDGERMGYSTLQEHKVTLASLLANFDVLMAPRSETNLALRDNAWREGFNQCLENLKTDVTNRLDEVMGK